MLPWSTNLQSTGLDDGRALAVLDGTAAGANSLKSLDNVERLLVGNLAEDDVAAVEPGGDNSGDEELGAVGVGTGVGHRQQTGLVVRELEVLIAKLLSVDGLATGAIATGEVATLEHEVRDDAVEGRSLVAEALLASAESAEVLGSLGNNVIIELEVDAGSLGLDSSGRSAALEDRTFPFNIEENSGHVCG